MGVELQLFFSELLALLFRDAADEFFPHAAGGFGLDFRGHGTHAAFIDFDADLRLAVDVLNGADKARHMVEVAVGLSVFFGDRTRFDADAISLFPGRHGRYFTWEGPPGFDPRRYWCLG